QDTGTAPVAGVHEYVEVPVADLLLPASDEHQSVALLALLGDHGLDGEVRSAPARKLLRVLAREDNGRRARLGRQVRARNGELRFVRSVDRHDAHAKVTRGQL